MNRRYWIDVVSRITPNTPVILDATVNGLPDAATDSLPVTGSQPFLAPIIFPKVDDSSIALGIRVSSPVEDAVAVSLQLATLALERSVVPVIFSNLDITGFEQFGFRVERLAAASESEKIKQEDELKEFWNIEIVLDLDEVLLMK